MARLEKIGSGGGSLDEKTNARLFLAQICSEIRNVACLIRNDAELLKLQRTITDLQKAAALWKQIAPSVARESLWAPKLGGQNIPKMLGVMNYLPVETIRPDKYLLLQSSAFVYFVENRQFVEARQTIARMIARAVALEPGDYNLPFYLAEIIQDLSIIGDGPRAYLLMQKLDNAVRSSLPPNNPTHIRYLQLTAELEASFGNRAALEKALSRLDAAETQLHRLRVGDEWTDDALTEIATQRTAYLIVAGNLPKAMDSFAAAPFQKRRNEIEASGHFHSSTELEFAVVDLFLNRVAGRPMDRNWKALLSQRLPWDTGNEIRPLLRYGT